MTLLIVREPVEGARMCLIEVPLNADGHALVQASGVELPGDPQLTSARLGEVVARARESLEQALDQIKPAVRAVLDRLVATSPDEAKGTSKVHFAATLAWKRPGSAADGD
ncbi:MAG: hypothetical protein ACRDTJ_10960 [Pseudonocardiaceae bacterium]